MKYILLDTNIVIDMVIDRRNQVTDAVLESFIKLLDYNEIKLIVPEIVKVETHRHLKEELNLVGEQIKKVMKNIDNLYGIATYKIDGLDIQEYKKHSKEGLNNAYKMYQKNEKKYNSNLVKTIDMVFNHKNSVVIPCDNFLSNAVMKRRIYKRAPFHKEKKESYADGLITETLINLGQYITLESSDEICFVTGNYSDFCVGKEDRTTLHADIVNDINEVGVPCKVKCINTFGELIGKELKDNVKTANLSDEFAKELQIQYEEEMKQFESYFRDMDRESADLTPMNGYTDKLEDNLISSDFVSDIVEKFEELNNIYETIENEGYNVIYEELRDMLISTRASEISGILEEFKNVFDQSSSLPNIGSGLLEDFTVEDLTIVFEWLDNQQRLMNAILDIDKLPDNIEYGDTVEIKDSEFNTLKFSLDDLILFPEEGTSEDIDMRLNTANGEILARGSVSVTYGFIKFDEDGGVGDGLEDHISYSYEDITDALEVVISEWKELVDEQIDIACQLKEQFQLD